MPKVEVGSSLSGLRVDAIKLSVNMLGAAHLLLLLNHKLIEKWP